MKAPRQLALAITVVVGLALIFALVIPGRSAGANQLIQGAMDRVTLPLPGQVAHYTYRIYYRTPPAGLEPSDPYHLPYAEIWREWVVEDNWLVLAEDGQLSRWRTQLHSADGILLQDLLYAGQTEVDYFPLEHSAFTVNRTSQPPYVDYRVQRFTNFLSDPALVRKANTSISGENVIAIYASPVKLDDTLSISDALLTFQGLFFADLDADTLNYRIDFDPETLSAVGEVTVVFDHSGGEHIVSYRTLGDPEILAPTDPRLEHLFELELPDGVIPDQQPSPTGEVFSDLDTIKDQVTFPLFRLTDGTAGLRQMSAGLSKPTQPVPIRPGLDGIYQASSLGLGVQISYLRPETGAEPAGADVSLTIIEGEISAMTQALRATWPTWLDAHTTMFRLAGQAYKGWVFTGGQASSRLKCVIEMPESLIYVEATGLSVDQLLEALELGLRPY